MKPKISPRSTQLTLAALLLVVFAAQAALASPSKSAALDEQYHLAAGYAYLRTGDFRLSIDHPPLVNALSAAPLLLLPDVALPLDHPAWERGDYFAFSDAFVWEANADPHRLFVLARLPIVALGLLLVCVVFVWARQMHGRRAGWLALLLAAFDPNLVANARLVTTDLGVTCFLFLATWRLWRWLERPTRLNLVLAGALAGLAMTAKFTGLLFWPIAGLIALVYPGGSPRRWAGLLGAALAAYATVWAVYGFDVSLLPGLPIPFPAPFYPYSVWHLFAIIQNEPVPAFLLGQVSPRGWWYYFPVALAVKTPLPLLLASLGAAGLSLRRSAWRRASVVWAPLAVFLGLALTGQLTIGYRHILPMVPFLILLASQLARLTFHASRFTPHVSRFTLYALLAGWSALGAARIFPHHEAYFNELAGGPEKGSHFLADSNLDWGQDLPALKQLMQERGLDQINLAYFGSALPEAYGIRYKPLPGFLRFLAGAEVDAYNPYTPEPGWYAISATSLRMGLIYRRVDLYAYFRDKTPLARAGYSINLYRVDYPENAPIDRIVVTGQPVAELAPEQLGLRPGHRLIVKWAQSPDTRITFDVERSALNIQPPIDFSGAFALSGYAIETTDLKPGQAISLTLYWRVGSAQIETPTPARRPPLAAFVHLIGGEPPGIAAQYDGWEAALTGLEPGDWIAQRVRLAAPVSAAPGIYYLRAGLYSPQSMQRLAAYGANGQSDYVELAAIAVR